MYNREKIEKTEKTIEKKYDPGVFLSLTVGGKKWCPKWH